MGAAMATPVKKTRRGRKPSPRLSTPDYPHTMRLPDGRTLCVEIPGRWMDVDRDGSPAFGPDAVAFLDRIRALFISALDRPPSPGYITRLREAMGMTQRQFGDSVGVDKMTVSRYERGTMRPSAATVKAIDKLRKHAIRRGVAIPA